MKITSPVHRSVLLPALAAGLLASSAWCQSQLYKWISTEPSLAGGTSVAIDGALAVAGGPDGLGAGSVFVQRFQPLGGVWTTTAEIDNPTSAIGAHFGESVSVSGARILIGAGYESVTMPTAGAAYVYLNATSGPTLEGELSPTALNSGDRFGSAVDLLGDVAAVGAPGTDAIGIDSGAVYMYRRSATGTPWGASTATLVPSSGSGSDAFGCSVALSTARILVGATSHASAGVACGAAYVYRAAGSSWVFEAELVPSTPLAGAAFGRSVDIEGDLALVGAPGENAAYLFLHAGTSTWTEVARLEGIFASELFGQSVALRGDRAIVGAPKSCRTDVFRHIGPANWVRSERFVPDTGRTTDEFGWSVAMSGDTLMIGAPTDYSGVSGGGAAYLEWSPPYATGFGYGDLGTCPCGNDDVITGCANGLGVGAQLRVTGTPSLAADDLVLRVKYMPVDRSCRLFLGDAVHSVVLGSGRRYVAGGAEGLSRLPLGNTGAAGEYVLGPGLSSVTGFADRVSAGETWFFQCWYRDPAAPCSGKTNLSNAVAIDFAP